MFKTFSKIHLSIISNIFLIIIYVLQKLNIGNGQALPGLLMQNLPIDYLKFYFDFFDSKYIFITGTNGKTSTTSMLNQLLLDSNYTVLSNLSGSNLKRGILSSFIFNFSKFKKHSPNFCVFEVDEATLPLILVSFPVQRHFSLLVLNLSRDQLDRYGEIDVLVDRINSSLIKFKKYSLFLNSGEYTSSFIKPYHLVNNNSEEFKMACYKFRIAGKSYLVENFSFVYSLIKELNLNIKYDLIPPFKEVSGRGDIYEIKDTKVTLNLTKNPSSFNTNLSHLTSNYENVLIYMNDNIPDGRDVSWFYDIDYGLLKSVLKTKNVFVCGTRAFDFYNLLNILNIPAFNFLTFSNSLTYFTDWGIKEVSIFSNYSATQNVLKIIKESE